MPDPVGQIFEDLKDVRIDPYITYAGLHEVSRDLLRLPDEVMSKLEFFGMENYHVTYKFPNGFRVSIVNGQMFNVCMPNESRNLFEIAVLGKVRIPRTGWCAYWPFRLFFPEKMVESMVGDPHQYLKPEQVKSALNAVFDLPSETEAPDAYNALMLALDAEDYPVI
jgi:hypothetical protein